MRLPMGWVILPVYDPFTHQVAYEEQLKAMWVPVHSIVSIEMSDWTDGWHTYTVVTVGMWTQRELQVRASPEDIVAACAAQSG